MNAVKRLQENPELGAYRIHTALLQQGINPSPSTCGRILALNRKLYHLQRPSKRVLLPRWMALILTPVVFLLGHVAVPQELSRLAARHGWTHGHPGCLRLHFVASGGSFEMEHTPKHLVVHGTYQFTRNPMWARPVDGSFMPLFLFMIWRARTLFSLLMARLLAVRGFDAIQMSLR